VKPSTASNDTTRHPGVPDALAVSSLIALSRFYKRWTGAEAGRPEMVAELAGSAMDPSHFAALLQREMDSVKGRDLRSAMRRVRNLLVCALIARDLSGLAHMAEVVRTISQFADFAIQTHLDAIMTEMIALHGTPTGEASALPQHMIVLGMGKLGGEELNVSSDVDLIFVYPEDGDCITASADQRSLSNHEFFTRVGKKLIAALSEITEDGFTFRVDMALRPNGNSGPLVASLNMVEMYLIRQGRDWERYAWTKARAVTGQLADILALEAIRQPFIFRRYLDYGSIDALRSMHGQIRAEVQRQETRHPDRSDNVKLGRGGIREIEFLSQVFQLIRGGRDGDLRDRSTRRTLRILADKGLLDAEVVEQLLEAYAFLRNVEHRLQYLEDAQTHTLPASPEDRLCIARMMRFPDADALMRALNQRMTFVAAQFDQMFSDKESGKQTDDDALACSLAENDSNEAIQETLTNLGFRDVATAAQRLQAVWRSPRLQALPEQSRGRLLALINGALQIIAKLDDGQLATFTRLLDFLEAIARRAAYLALLSEYPHALKRLIRMMHASDWAAKYLTQHPVLLDELLDDRTLKATPDWQAFTLDCQRQLDTAAGDTERQMDLLREMHHAQVFRLLAQDLEGDLSIEALADNLSALADILVAATVQAVWLTIANRHREVPRFAVIAYGKLGGKELGYVSDLDVVFLYDDDDQEAPGLYAKLAQRFITWMTAHTSAGTLFDIDIALRPDGASGLLVSPIDGFEKYQRTSAWLWEHQALTRARFCSGDTAIGARFESLREAVLVQAREPVKLADEICAMRKRMHDAHPNRSAEFDVKHDAGGMIDIEFAVQFIVLRHAEQHPALIGDIGNIALLKLAGALGLIDTELANQVADAYRIFRKLQHQIRMQGEERARVPPQRLAAEIGSVQRLWADLFPAQPAVLPMPIEP
jgi:glutamate-ammonia-ligase adenylyltransferase